MNQTNLEELQIEIVRSKRRTMSMEMKESGILLVRAPRMMSQKAIMEEVSRHSAWIVKRLQRMKRQEEVCRTEGVLSEEEIEALKKRAKKVFAERTAYFAPRVGRIGVSCGRITVRVQQSRFGSCSAAGNLNFNAALLLAPAEVLDYVVVHELCHRLHMNHSEAFWQEVERVLPDYRAQRKWLKDHGGEILARCGAK